MGYNKDELEEQALNAIEDHKVLFITDLVAFLPCNRATFYNHKLGELDSIKEAIEDNRIKRKNGLQQKWYNNGNATTEIVLYKLLASQEEIERLNSQYIDHTSKGESIKIYFDK